MECQFKRNAEARRPRRAAFKCFGTFVAILVVITASAAADAINNIPKWEIAASLFQLNENEAITDAETHATRPDNSSMWVFPSYETYNTFPATPAKHSGWRIVWLNANGKLVASALLLKKADDEQITRFIALDNLVQLTTKGTEGFNSLSLSRKKGIVARDMGGISLEYMNGADIGPIFQQRDLSHGLFRLNRGNYDATLPGDGHSVSKVQFFSR